MKILLRDIIKIMIGQVKCPFCATTDRVSLYLGLCRNCKLHSEKELVQNISIHTCIQCGQPLLSEHDICTDCRKEILPLQNHTLFLYNGMGQDLIYLYKFQKYRCLADYFAYLLDRHLRKLQYEDYFLVPVPPSPGKVWKKGWDQIDLIVRIMKKKYAWSLIFPLKKQRGTTIQKKLNRQERKENISGRFYIKGKKKLPLKIILIDDVMTTGSTLNECYQTLIQGGASDVKSFTIARDF